LHELLRSFDQFKRRMVFEDVAGPVLHWLYETTGPENWADEQRG
jgi:hypothetical protein